MHDLTLTHELAEIRTQIARLQEREAALRASLRDYTRSGDRPGWPIQRVEGAGAHGGLRT